MDKVVNIGSIFVQQLYAIKDALASEAKIDFEGEDYRYFTFLMANMGLSNAQNFQDLWVLYEMNKKAVPNPGIYVDFGATDGKISSNSYLLETVYGWRGVLSEPNPFWHDALLKNRSQNNSFDFRCVAGKSNETINFVCTQEPELSTMSDYVNSDYHYSKRKFNTVVKHIKSVSLQDLIMINFPDEKVINYLSIDTEGSEYDILKAYDFGEAPAIELITVEHNYNDGQRQKIFDLLTSNGYERVFEKFSRWDDFYRLKQ